MKTRSDLLAAARDIVTKARDEHRGLTEAEQGEVDSHLDAVRDIDTKAATDARAAADHETRRVLGGLDAMAAGRSHSDESRRLDFKGMARAAADAIMPPTTFGSKALAPSGATVIAQTFATDPIALGQPAASLLSVLPVTVQETSLFAYMRQTTRTNAAAVVAEGAVKPTSVYSVTKIEQTLATIAHLSEGVSRFWFIDAESLQQFLNNELTYGLSLAVEAKAIADIAGTLGIQSNAYSVSVLQTLRKSVTKLEANGYPPGGFVLHPLDFESIELALLSTPAIEYQSLPFDAVARRLWGIPVTTTNAQTAGVAHTLATGAVGLNTGSEGVQIAWSETSNADDFSRNLIRARCEGRYATSVFQPLGVVQSDLTA